VARFHGEDVHLIGFPGCFTNACAQTMMERLCTHPNVGAVPLLSLGCESFNKFSPANAIRESGRPVETLTIQTHGGTRSTVAAGRDWVAARLEELAAQGTVPMGLDELIVGTICGVSDGTSGLTGNPAAGRAFDRLVEAGATCIFEETGE
jgi:altronate dehydratase large subunit